MLLKPQSYGCWEEKEIYLWFRSCVPKWSRYDIEEGHTKKGFFPPAPRSWKTENVAVCSLLLPGTQTHKCDNNAVRIISPIYVPSVKCPNPAQQGAFHHFICVQWMHRIISKMNEKALDSFLIHLYPMVITPQFIKHQMHISETQWQLNSAGKGISLGRAETSKAITSP